MAGKNLDKILAYVYSWCMVTFYISIIATIAGFIIGLTVGVIRTIPLPERGAKGYF